MLFVVTGEWRKLHNKELHDLYSSPSIIRIGEEDEMGGAYRKNSREDSRRYQNF
jgi:hypothetical protein